MSDFRSIADTLATEIEDGRMPPGTRLDPVRRFAYARGIAVSTANRVYAELARRALVAGEIGRGTYVRSRLLGTPLAEPGRPGLIDFEFNFPTLPGQSALLAEGIRAVLAPERLEDTMRAVGAQGHAAARAASARHLARPGWAPDPAHLLFTGGGRQAIGAALAAVAAAGERIGIEAMTYPAVKAMAGRLGQITVPLALDAEGVTPESVEAACRLGPLRALYLQPALHNPSGVGMGLARRQALVALARREGLVLIEDTVFGFLDDSGLPPLSALLPEQAILVDGLSKRASPGLSGGMLVIPSDALRRRAAGAIRAGAWHAAPLGLAAATHWMESGLLAEMEARKRADARARQTVLREALAGHALLGDPRAYHLWLELPEPWRADFFAAAAMRQGVAVTPSGAFAASAGHAPNGVRIAFSSPGPDSVRRGAAILAGLLAEGPEGLALSE
jgi:DNA-binding transcriptional MocR family regulator